MTALDYLKDLVAIPSVSSDRAACRQVLEYVAQSVKDLPVQVEWFEDGGYESLLVTTRATKTPDVWLAAHLDVVAAPPELFALRQEGDTLYGRGVIDMKYATACYLELIHSLGDSLPEYDFGLMLTTDEEIGGMHGTKALADAGYRSKLVILPDGGENWELITRSKGVWQLKLTAKGQAAHGAHPWEGDNAIERLHDFLTELRGLGASWAEEADERHEHATLNIGMIQGGAAVNQVPDHVEATADIRIYREEDRPLIVAAVDDLIRRHPAVSYEVLAEGGCFWTDPALERVAPFRAVVEEIIAQPLREGMTHGATDARFFSEYDIPVVIMYPPGGELHTNNEWVSAAGVQSFAQALQEYFRRHGRQN